MCCKRFSGPRVFHKGSSESECAAAAGFACDRDLPTHETRQFRRDCQAQADAAVFSRRGGVILLERSKDHLLLIGLDANSRVADEEINVHLTFRGRFGGGFHLNQYLADFSELDRIAHHGAWAHPNDGPQRTPPTIAQESSSVARSPMRDDSVRGSRAKGTREEQAENDRSVECQPFGAGARRSLASIFTRSARESAFIFRITLPRCAFTVISLMPSSPPTCLFSKPETTNAMTSRSRRLREAYDSRSARITASWSSAVRL